MKSKNSWKDRGQPVLNQLLMEVISHLTSSGLMHFTTHSRALVLMDLRDLGLAIAVQVYSLHPNPNLKFNKILCQITFQVKT
jgi:hypothetical protein